MHFLYNILAVLIVILATPVLLFRLLREPGFGKRLRQSFGFLPEAALAKVAGKGCVWLHAASVGEIVATSPIVKEIHKQLPGVPVLISVVTASGYDMAHLIIPEAASIIYFPIDLPFLTHNVVSKIRPRAFLMVETELWPNFLHAAKAYNIPAMMVNGRISDKSAVRYKYLRNILRNMLGTINIFCMQSALDAEYIIRLGADPQRVVVTGNTKFDQTYTAISAADQANLRTELHLTTRQPLIIAGSTHKGEEEMLFAAMKAVKRQYPAAGMILAPRDIARAGELVTLAGTYGLSAGYRTQVANEAQADYDVIILDTIGELGKVYSLGDIIFVGGSLVATGGHNILEPAAHGKPILVGPHMFNFKETYTLFSEREACATVRDTQELTEQLLALLDDAQARAAMSQRCLTIIRENQGAAQSSARYLRQLITQEAFKIKAEQGLRQSEKLQLYLYKFAHRRPRGPISLLLLGVLRLLSWLYALAVTTKLALYKVGILKQHQLPCTVISLGNITVGGTGKTPTAERLATIIRDMGYKVVILNRGYRAQWQGEVGVVSDGQAMYMSAGEAGDEAYLLAKSLPGVPVVIGRNRAVTGAYAVNTLGADVIILDDAYQHWRLARDLDIVLIDTINVFGNNCMLPRGTLREPLRHLNRAHVFLLTKVDQSAAAAREALRDQLFHYNEQALIVESVHQPRVLTEIAEWYTGTRTAAIDLATLKDQSVVAFSAIGNPASFEQTVADVGAKVVDGVRFPDHHNYGLSEMQYIMQKAVDKGACALITTEKDAVKIPPEFIQAERQLPLYILGIEMQFLDGNDELLALINKTVMNKQAERR